MAFTVSFYFGYCGISVVGIVVLLHSIYFIKRSNENCIHLEVAAPRDIKIHRLHEWYTDEQVESTFAKFSDINDFEPALNDLVFEDNKK